MGHTQSRSREADRGTYTILKGGGGKRGVEITEVKIMGDIQTMPYMRKMVPSFGLTCFLVVTSNGTSAGTRRYVDTGINLVRRHGISRAAVCEIINSMRKSRGEEPLV
ncbi:hypothetical protein COV06_03620 [Candidatus Uhrbacteria bacterium CG10_big_fil_rev_8_21_14_0_10_50_16]|uniref:Uncharacterized protein n=1 Tax=Candidatus Uhrbacteria bacterium CG10_big_fil_rev_8_21_14_0_10_50_16 TaxID=1975039 RepID=A0A2H0RLZ2_9BACT|nr:MAG: hypothetical protein COV06_03620 [Candidatus Uhrbacteria bacterium CG10_big_fil_rev_8_21_14_0_10_50_16]